MTKRTTAPGKLMVEYIDSDGRAVKDSLSYYEGDTIIEVIKRAGIEIGNVCGGMGTCGTCHLLVTEGLENLDPRNEIESERAIDLGFQKDERLACQTECKGSVTIKLMD